MFNPATIHIEHQRILNIISSGSTEDFIQFAKSYNIFQESKTKIYTTICNLIKERMDKENLSYDLIKPGVI
jgi:hypothetical protein